MAKAYFTFFSLKTCAYALVFINLVGGLTELVVAGVYLPDNNYEEFRTQLILSILLGIITIFNGVLLGYGLFTNKTLYILWYLFFGSIDLLIVTIFAITNMLILGNAWLLFLLGLCIVCWYGHLCLYHLYEELLQDNSVNAGVIEIAYNANTCYENAAAMTKEESF